MAKQVFFWIDSVGSWPDFCQTVSLGKHKATYHHAGIMPCKYASNMEGFLPNSFTSTFSSCDKLDLFKTAETSSKLYSSNGNFILIYHYSQNP